MIVSVSSGKGGAGKTTISTSLFLSYEGEVAIFDCDVEEPDVHLFLKPEIEDEKSVYVEVPELIKDKCDGCHKCAEICEYNAIMKLKGSVLIFEDLCHSCGGCFRVCPRDALLRKKKEIGRIRYGVVGKEKKFVEGRLNIGGTLTTHLIKEILREVHYPITIVDGPPGSSCPSVSIMEKSDYIIFVVEATPYGISDFKRVLMVAEKFNKRMGIIINKISGDITELKNFCMDRKVEVLMEIPFDFNIAKSTSRGENLIEINPGFLKEFKRIWDVIVGGTHGK